MIDETGKMPGWAIDLTLKVARAAGRDTVPVVAWRIRHRQSWKAPSFSSGHFWVKGQRIVVTAGRSRTDQRLVLLHELAHWLAPDDEHHGERFWTLAFALYRLYGVRMAYARKREAAYRKMSVKVAARF